MFEKTQAVQDIAYMLKRDLGFSEYQNNRSHFTPNAVRKLIADDEIEDLLNLFFKALDMDKAKNFEELDDLKERIIREFSGEITDSERSECFKSFSKAEQVVKHFVYLTDPASWEQVCSENKTLAPCLRILKVIPGGYGPQAINLNGDPLGVYRQMTVRSDYPYLEHVLRVYQWRNNISHNAPVPSRFELPLLEQSLWFVYLYVVKLHKETLRKLIENREKQSFERIEYCRELVEFYDIRNSTFKYFDFKWNNRATNTSTTIDSTMTLNNNVCLLFGEAGSGKSVALTRLCHMAAKKHIEDPVNPIPVLIELKSLTAKDHIQSRVARLLECSDSECDMLLNKGRILLFLDGVNEIVSWDSNRATVQLQRDFISEIAILFNRYPKTRMWISDRAMTNFGGDVRREIVKLELQKVTAQDIINFCKSRTPDATLLNGVTLPEGVTSFLNTPFKIQIFCDLLTHTRSVPESEVQLIGKYLEMIIDREYNEKATLNLTSTWIFYDILETLSAAVSYNAGSISIATARKKTLEVLNEWSNNPREVDNCLKIAGELKILQFENDRISFFSEKYFAYFLASHARKLAERGQ